MLATMLPWVALGAAWSATDEGGDPTEQPDQPAQPVLAIPAGGEVTAPGGAARGGPAVRPPPVQVTVRSPAVGPERSRALRAYRDEHLSLRRSSEFVSQTSFAWGFRTAPRWGMFGWGAWWPQVSTYEVDRIGVVQGHAWLDVPAVLEALGDGGAGRDLERRIQGNRNAASFLHGVAVVGVGGIVTGLVGADRAANLRELRDWQRITTAGIGLTIGGLMASAIPGSRADKLRYDITRTMPLDEVRNRIADHNTELAEDLGIEPDVAIRLESE